MRNRKGKRNASLQYKGERQTPKDKELGNWRIDIYDPDIGRIYLGLKKVNYKLPKYTILLLLFYLVKKAIVIYVNKI